MPRSPLPPHQTGGADLGCDTIGDDRQLHRWELLGVHGPERHGGVPRRRELPEHQVCPHVSPPGRGKKGGARQAGGFLEGGVFARPGPDTVPSSFRRPRRSLPGRSGRTRTQGGAWRVSPAIIAMVVGEVRRPPVRGVLSRHASRRLVSRSRRPPRLTEHLPLDAMARALLLGVCGVSPP